MCSNRFASALPSATAWFGVFQSENSMTSTFRPCCLARPAANWMMSAIGPGVAAMRSGLSALAGPAMQAARASPPSR